MMIIGCRSFVVISRLSPARRLFTSSYALNYHDMHSRLETPKSMGASGLTTTIPSGGTGAKSFTPAKKSTVQHDNANQHTID